MIKMFFKKKQNHKNEKLHLLLDDEQAAYSNDSQDRYDYDNIDQIEEESRNQEHSAFEYLEDEAIYQRSETQDDDHKIYYQEENEIEVENDDYAPIRKKRAKYHAKIDRFLTNGIIIVGVLLLGVLLIAFMG